MNFVMLPMWIFSGVFFSPSRFPDALQPLIGLLPLTALNESLRMVMLDGASVADVASRPADRHRLGRTGVRGCVEAVRWK
jgi:ABC-type polysaccharide/polyol phosphate export permease